MRDSDGIDPRARLFDLGLESLMAVEMRGRFEESLGCSLRPTLLFDYPTIEALVDHLAGKVSEKRTETSPAPQVNTRGNRQALTGEIQDLGEDEIADLLAQELMTTKVQEQ
jgi:acyl carrier protein